MTSHSAARERGRAVRAVLLRIMVANLLVLALKAAVGLRTGSLAVLGDALHASVDAVNNLFGLAVVRLAAKAPDDDHPYGHAKFETLGALLIVVIMSVSLFQLVEGAVNRLRTGAPPPSVSNLGFALLLVTLAVNLWVVWAETRAARRFESDILHADAAHTRVDVFITIAVIVGLLLARGGLWWADPVLALVVGVLVVRVAYQIVRQSMPTLVDAVAVAPEDLARAARQVAGVQDAYAIRSRQAAAQRFAELTISVDGTATVTEGHAVADAVEAALQERYGLTEVVVHVEPC